jgi:Fur family zinc uptake transcriptional regulator
MTDTAFPHPHHDHDHCVEDALTRADTLCRAQGARLTDIRRDVLELVWANHAPVGAYELMDKLEERRRETGSKRARVAPPTVYRALDFLREHRLIHRIESLNAFVGCSNPGVDHAGRFLICERCGVAAEIEDDGLEAAIIDSARRHGFEARRITVEVAGTCPDCAAG